MSDTNSPDLIYLRSPERKKLELVIVKDNQTVVWDLAPQQQWNLCKDFMRSVPDSVVVKGGKD